MKQYEQSHSKEVTRTFTHGNRSRKMKLIDKQNEQVITFHITYSSQ